MNEKKIKLCYAINEYNSKTDTHYKAIYELLEECSDSFDIFLILEKKSSHVDLKVKKYYVSKFNIFFLKFIELFFISFYARVQGYNTFYSHYTTISRINFGIISRVFYGKSYHWHCGIMKLFWKDKIKSFKDFKDKILIEWPERLSWKLNHYLVTGNLSMKNIYNKDYQVPLDKIKLLPNWVDVNRFSRNNYNSVDIRKALDITPNKKVLLFVHRIVERKGAHYIVPIIKEVIKYNNEIVLLVIGDGPYLEKLRKEIKKNNLNTYILILGKVPNIDLPKYFSISDLFIMPSEEEGFPRVLIESLAMGVPYVASDVGGVKEITPKCLRKNVVNISNLDIFIEKVLLELKEKKRDRNSFISYVNKNFSKNVVKKYFINLF